MRENERLSDDLAPKQERAILALLTEPNIREAAKKAKVSEATLFRWLREAAFSKAYLEARRLSTIQTIAQLQGAGSKAVEALVDVIENAVMNPAARVSAAKAVLEMSMKAVELEDLAQRVEELEKHHEKKGGR